MDKQIIKRRKAQREKDKLARLKLRKNIEISAVDQIARHFLANQEILRKLTLQQNLIRQEIIKRAKGKSKTWNTERYQVELAVSKRRGIKSMTEVELALGQEILKKHKLYKSTVVNDIHVEDLQKDKKRKK